VNSRLVFTHTVQVSLTATGNQKNRGGGPLRKLTFAVVWLSTNGPEYIPKKVSKKISYWIKNINNMSANC
jgi:hypothetical protein